MKKRKKSGLSGKDRRKTVRNTDQYTEEFYNEDYADQEYQEETPDEDDEYIVDYISDDDHFGERAPEDMQEYAEEGYEAPAHDEYDFDSEEEYGAGENCDTQELYIADALKEYETDGYRQQEPAYQDEAYYEQEADSGYEEEAQYEEAYNDEETGSAYEEAYYERETDSSYEEEAQYEETYNDEETGSAYEEAYYEQEADSGYEEEAQYGQEIQIGFQTEAFYVGMEQIDDYAEDTESYYEDAADETDETDEDSEYCGSDEYDDEYDNDDSFDTAYGNYDDHVGHEDASLEPDVPYGAEQTTGIGERLRHWAGRLTAFDAILASTGVVLLVAAGVILSMFLQTKRVNQQIEALAPMGSELTSMGVIGGDGLLAMANAAFLGSFVEDAGTEELEIVEDTVSDKINVNFSSVQRDLKIRFTDAVTGNLITGTVFEVTLTNSNGKKLVLTDDDMDGIIYAENVNPGVFDAVVTSTDKYKFPTVPQQVTVKDKVEYIVINDIKDEVKTESQVNTALEDTQKKDALDEAETLADTVEWVESSKTAIDGTEAYLLVDKNTIADPAAAAKAGARMLFDTFNVTLDKTSLSLLIGGSADIQTQLPQAPDENTKYEYTTEWKSSNESVATVSGGKVTAKAAGTATITCTVTRKTTTTKTVEGETKTTTTTEEGDLTVEQYNELQAKGTDENTRYEFTEKKDEGGEITGYHYKKTVTSTEKGESRTETVETTDSSSATCTVTVSAAKITSGSLELSKSADSCSVGATLTVKPSKLVYTKEDGSTESVTSFPTVAWSSSDKTIATVDANGVVTGVKEGTVTITGTISGIKGANDKEIPISASVSVTISAAQALTLTLDRTKDVYIVVGGSTTLVATVSNYKSDSGVTWETSDSKVATVDEKGVVTGVAVGSVTITATTKEKGADGKVLTAACTVTVNSNASSDTTTKLKDKSGNQIYVKDKDGNYREAVYADYYTETEFYIRTEGQYKYTGWQTIDGKTYYYDKNGNVVTGTQIIQGVTYNFGTDGAIATTVNGSTFGIDVSRHNGNIDWNAVKASGVDYVIIRCGYRGSATGVLIQDENFVKNIQGATAAGLKVGVYVFSQAIDEVEAVKEASLAVQLVKGYNLTYPIFIDTESSGGRADKIDKATRTAVVNAFCQTVATAGYKPGIYASKTWFEDKLNMSAIGNYKIWLAQYASAPTYKGRYDMWQYSSKGKISGINGDVDLNYSYLGY